MPRKERFEYDSVQDLETITTYLNALLEGFQHGELRFSHRDQEVIMQPQGLLGFSLRASSKGMARKLKLKFKWEEKGEEEESQHEPLLIRST